MPSGTEQEPERALLEDAAKIFLGLREDPKNDALKRRRAAFIGQSVKHREAYARIEKMWSVSGPKKRSTNLASVLIALLVLASAIFYGYQPLRVSLLASHSAASGPAEYILTSGDFVHIDADSALIDKTDGDIRSVTLLKGAAYFDVRSSARAFRVEIADKVVTVLGTAFETTLTSRGATITVNKGVVEVSTGVDVWRLAPGQRILLPDDGAPTIKNVSVDTVASWRTNRLNASGMTFSEVAEVIDRRIAGPVFVIGSDLAEASVSGVFDLTRPELALRALAETRSSDVHYAAPVGVIVINRR